MADLESEWGSAAVVGESKEIVDFPKMYSEEVAKSKLSIVVATDILPISCVEFFALFIEDDAPYNLIK